MRIRQPHLGKDGGTVVALGIAICATAPADARAQTTADASASLTAASIETLLASVAIGAVVLALGALWAAGRAFKRNRRDLAVRADRMAELETKLDSAESILAAEPDAVFIWAPERSVAPTTGTRSWGRPRVVGSTAGLADPSSGTVDFDFVLSRLQPEDSESLRNGVSRLRERGARFSLNLQMRDGRTYEAEGRPAGAQAVLWMRDITGEREEETRLVETARKAERDRTLLSQVTDAAPFPAWRRSADGTLIWVNQAYATAVDAPDADAVVSDPRELLDAATRKAAAAAIATQTKYRDRSSAVVGGERQVLDVIELPLTDGGSAGFAIDITPLAESEADLKRHLEAHGDTLNRLASAVAIFGPDRRLRYYNRAFQKLWRLEESFLDTEPAEGELLEMLREARRLPEQADFRQWKQSRLGLYTRNEQTDELWHLPDGQTLRVIGQPHPFGGLLYLYENVTTQLKLESSLTTAQHVQSETLNKLYEGVAVFGSDGRLKLHNPAYQRIWHLDTAQLSGEPHIDQIIEWCRGLYDNADDWNAIKARITSVSDEQAADDRGKTGRLQRPDGSVVDYASVPLPDGNTLLTYVDVTDTSRIERALRDRNDALETADRLKSEFISHVSYQLRTPLTNIIGFGEILNTELFGPLNEKQSEYASGVLKSASELLDLVNDIIDLASIEAGAMALDVDDVRLSPVMRQVFDMAHPRAQQGKRMLELEAASDLGVIKADARRLKQILFNLLSNAISFTNPGDTITLGGDREGDEIRLWVRDTGDGIKPEHQATVFDRFEARGSSEKRRGAGLGLTLVRSFVEMHGGWVSLESAPREGTRVTCHLPADAKPLAAPQPEEPGNAAAS